MGFTYKGFLPDAEDNEDSPFILTIPEQYKAVPPVETALIAVPVVEFT